MDTLLKKIVEIRPFDFMQFIELRMSVNMVAYCDCGFGYMHVLLYSFVCLCDPKDDTASQSSAMCDPRNRKGN